jgi:uncharacterized protein (TIGR00255 family)
MTGYGRGSFADDKYSISIELKTVNNRFLDISLRLSSDLSPLEAELKRRIGARLSRGRVDVNLQYERSGDIVYDLNRPLIGGYIAAMKKMQDEFSLTGEPDLNVIARLPNVIAPERTELEAEFTDAVGKALDAALDDLEKMREKEGEMLFAELETRLGNIESRMPSIAAEADGVTEEYRQRLSKRIGEMLARSDSQIDIDQARLAQEVVYLADRADISEEISRLSTHIEHFRAIMNEEKEVGKRLDFLTQELNREANTITSKTANMNIKENALQIKSEIEKIREQVQNVE